MRLVTQLLLWKNIVHGCKRPGISPKKKLQQKNKIPMLGFQLSFVPFDWRTWGDAEFNADRVIPWKFVEDLPLHNTHLLRRPLQSHRTTARARADVVRWLSFYFLLADDFVIMQPAPLVRFLAFAKFSRNRRKNLKILPRFSQGAFFVVFVSP